MSNQDLERYGILMSYLQYENTIYWGRGNFFLLAQSALFGFVIASLPSMLASTPWNKILIPGFGSIAGLIVARMWQIALRSGEFWINHWHSILMELEPKAFGKQKVLRGLATLEGQREPKERARMVAHDILILFYVLWIILVAYLLSVSVLKIFT